MHNHRKNYLNKLDYNITTILHYYYMFPFFIEIALNNVHCMLFACKSIVH